MGMGTSRNLKYSNCSTYRQKRCNRRVGKGPQYKLKKGAEILARLRRWAKRSLREAAKKLASKE